MPFGIATEVREEQYWNAEYPMEIMLFGIVTAVSEIQDLNALLPIEVTSLPSITPGISTIASYPMYFVISTSVSPLMSRYS